MAFLPLRNLLRQRVRTSLTLAAVAFGVAGLVLAGGFVEDLLVQLREATIHSQLGHLQIHRKGEFASGGHQPLEFIIDDPARVERLVAANVPGVVAQAQRLAFQGLVTNGRGELPVLGEGVQPVPEARIGSAIHVLSGRALAAGDRFAIVLGEGMARALRLAPGMRVNLVVNTPQTGMNTLDFEVVGVFRSLSKEYDARAVRIPLAAAQELLGTRGANAIVVLLDDTARTGAARDALARVLPRDLELRTWRELADFYNATAALYEREFAVLQLVILVMVLLSVANSINMTLHERTAEFGVMRALGRTGRDVFRMAVTECSLLGIAGALLGVAVGALIALAVSAIGIPMPPPPNSESGFTATIRLVPSQLALAFAVGALAAVLASLLPARHLARIPVVEALRRAV
jgi:putative ABC transport system permease protein